MGLLTLLEPGYFEHEGRIVKVTNIDDFFLDIVKYVTPEDIGAGISAGSIEDKLHFAKYVAPNMGLQTNYWHSSVLLPWGDPEEGLTDPFAYMAGYINPIIAKELGIPSQGMSHTGIYGFIVPDDPRYEDIKDFVKKLHNYDISEFPKESKIQHQHSNRMKLEAVYLIAYTAGKLVKAEQEESAAQWNQMVSAIKNN